MAFALGIRFYNKSPSLYLGFTLWLWLLTPEVRRLVDFHTYFHTQSPVQLAPYMVTGLTIFSVARNLRQFRYRRLTPFALVLFGVLYGYGVGIFSSGIFAATYDLLTWLTPVTFGFYLAIDSKGYARNAAAIQKAMAVGLLVIATYGVIQFFQLPPWDAFWLNESKLTSMGRAESLEVRIFGTLNISGVYAVTLVTGLTYALAGRGWLNLAAGTAGLPALILSQSRSSWGALVLALGIFLFRGSAKSKLRIVGSALLLICFALPVLTLGPLAKNFSSRVSTLQNIESDASFRARIIFYRDFIDNSLSTPLGTGLGSTGTAAILATGSAAAFDSGLINIPYVLGWPGAFLYDMGLGWITVIFLLARPKSSDRLVIANIAVAMPILIEMVFANTVIGVQGVFFWAAIGLISAQQAWVRSCPEIKTQHSKPISYSAMSQAPSRLGA